MAEPATRRTQQSVTDMTRRLALTVRLLVVAVAFLFSSAPSEAFEWGDKTDASRTSIAAGNSSKDPGLSLANAPTADLLATVSPTPADGDAEGPAAALAGGLVSFVLGAPLPGYLLPYGSLLATAFAPRGPPAA
jgi:hypothetical protein